MNNKKIHFKIYGLQRSGTNYMEWLLNNNFKNHNTLKHGNILGWKHGFPVLPEDIDWTGKNWDNQNHHDQDDVARKLIKYKQILDEEGGKEEILNAAAENRLKFIFCVRSPYSWAVSRGPRWSGVEDLPGDVMENSSKFWNEMAESYMAFASKNKENCLFVNHSDLVNNCEEIVSWIGKRCGIDTPEKIITTEKTVSCGIWDQEVEEKPVNAKYKRGTDWVLSSLQPSGIKAVYSNINPDILNFLGMKIYK